MSGDTFSVRFSETFRSLSVHSDTLSVSVTPTLRSDVSVASVYFSVVFSAFLCHHSHTFPCRFGGFHSYDPCSSFCALPSPYRYIFRLLYISDRYPGGFPILFF
jgi:hypothetical protein